MQAWFQAWGNGRFQKGIDRVLRSLKRQEGRKSLGMGDQDQKETWRRQNKIQGANF